jgi:mannose-1-phosphate guanylyltransferase
MLHALIMAGGSGTRFWPASRVALPKQLLALPGPSTMLQATLDRLGDLVPAERTRVFTNRALVARIRELLPELPPEATLGEPCRRDTAPCIGLAAGMILRQDPDATMVVMPADHVIEPPSIFRNALRHAARLVVEHPDWLVTFGIQPTYPAETFGYIERGDAAPADPAGPPTFQVRKFHEKPAADVARQYLAAGGYYWNSGIFVWKANTILGALREFEPEIHRRLETILQAQGSDRFADCLAREFAAIEGKSIDFAVMERYRPVIVVEAPFEWDDLGSWQSLARRHKSDDDGNTVLGQHVGIDTRGCIIRGEVGHLIVTLGLEDCIVVQTPDATLVAGKHHEESIRQVVKVIQDRGWDEFL